ncbi:hypothetical protein ACWGI8_30960 [Streptomyces sp. NPDC054841]
MNGLGWAATIVAAAVLYAVLPQSKATAPAAEPVGEREPATVSI